MRRRRRKSHDESQSYRNREHSSNIPRKISLDESRYRSNRGGVAQYPSRLSVGRERGDIGPLEELLVHGDERLLTVTTV